MGIYIWKPYELQTGRGHIWLGDFEIWSFPVSHDSVPCCGFIIKVDDEYAIYVTDAEYVKYNFKDLKPVAILIECNYQSKYVDMNIDHLAHVYRGHMELRTCCGFIKANQSKHLKNVILCHLSLSNANPEECRKAVTDITEATVDVAQAGMTIKIGDVTKGRIENDADFY